MGKPEKVETVGDTGLSNADAAPPSYNAPLDISISLEDIDQLNLAFSSLEVPLVAKTVTPDTCLAHLKLLFAFQNLKETVGYRDGLWRIYDSRVLPAGKDTGLSQETDKLDDETKKNLSLLREKRWSLYVARAADRYIEWWKTFPKNNLVENDMSENTAKYTTFTSKPPSKDPWKIKLPPLAYLEDCMRYGLGELWHSGMPWQLINDAIDTNFNYTVSPDCMATWEEKTFLKWDSANDPVFKTLPPCPRCRLINVALWTTCGMAEDSQDKPPSLVGQGYGDGDFQMRCCKCDMILKRDYLEVSEFATDVKNNLARRIPMPGTILDSKTGMAKQLPQPGTQKDRFQRTFPNRLIRYDLRSRLYDPPLESMDAVRKIIEKALANPDVIKKVEYVAVKDNKKSYRLGQEARIHVRKMMSRYWGNSSPFALELGGAVLRQGIFTEKMYKMDWLHSPAARETMVRLIAKYDRFITIMGKFPNQIAVPTLDVDLAWHTHQLSPASYYESVCSKTGRFIDHDDKIAEDKLSTSFEWTSKVYQELYAPDKFYQSGRAALCPPDNSAHISAHNSVRVIENDSIRSKVHRQMHLLHQKRLEENYEKARKRAKKKGRDLPPRDDYYYYYWGAPYLLYAPYVYPAYCVCPVYYDTTTVTAGSGYYGACAAVVEGTEGQSVAVPQASQVVEAAVAAAAVEEVVVAEAAVVVVEAAGAE
ncbi:hypothetical protein GQX73_g3622 [Xylaria multiplex]|uniref:Uncharacterized protein n=1 Tax=Xylaria multiplex TaxID=323545 RepID=A0A7C8IU40_9PEZI|nr:hypothetical protein GQX73_g3622 [Xylaria multiplex]